MRWIIPVFAVLASGAAMAEAPPGAPPAPFEVKRQIDATTASSSGPFRTRHIDAQGRPRFSNRLVLERAPYLRQHAHNPVDWRPWGPEALADAKALDRMIFLSVGYATCHWCHVMEEESFDDVMVAEGLNRNFIAVKVDRETLPEIDAQYMLATQLLNGRGGWPNNLFLTPDGQPVAAMGYAPRNIFLQSLAGVADDWRNPEGRPKMEDQAASVAEFVRLVSGARGAAGAVGEEQYRAAAASELETHDSFNGGFGRAPKFPSEITLRMLLERYERKGDEAALEAALTTLRAIAAGGITDQVGGGFHRYAVDEVWRTPHFEKMLYTQALLTDAFLSAWRMERDPALARAARRTLDYVLREMTAPEGGFYAAQDADSAVHAGGEMEEGAFYTWTEDQLSAALGGDASYARDAIGLYAAPTVPTGSVAHYDPLEPPDFNRLAPLLERMRAARASRPAPLTDRKIIAAWNGMMIRTLAKASVLLDEPRYLRVARRAADFVSTRMLSGDTLARAWAEGPLEQGSLRDYAWMGLAAVALHDAAGDPRWLDLAGRLASAIPARFSEGSDNPYRLAQSRGPLGATYDVIEGANPTGNAAALELFALLGRRGADDARAVENTTRADTLLAVLSGSIIEAPEANASTLNAAAVHLFGETGAVRALGGGVATARMSADENSVRVALNFAPGWHANAHTPLDPDLIPTRLAGLGLGAPSYPTPRRVKLRFQSDPLLVIDGAAEIAAQRSVGASQAELTIQICGEDLCLQPETVVFRLPR